MSVPCSSARHVGLFAVFVGPSVGTLLALAACSPAAEHAAPAGDASARAAVDTTLSATERYPADVFRPSGYAIRRVDETANVLSISGDAPDALPEVFAQARAAMAMQGWEETRVEQSATIRSLAFEKAGFAARLTFHHNGAATRFDMQLRNP